MKLADGIVGALVEDGCLITKEANEIIAAKLEPIKEALESIEYLVIADDIALSYVRPALALLSEEDE